MASRGTSVNHVVCHGVPGEKRLRASDIVNIDITVIKDGYHGDTSRMFYVGTPSIQAKRLCEVTYECMWHGIEAVLYEAELFVSSAALLSLEPRDAGALARLASLFGFTTQLAEARRVRLAATQHRIIIDIQHARTGDHYDRFLYYHCAALLEQLASSHNYRPPLAVYTVVVLTSGDRHQCDIAVTDFDPHDLTGRPLKEIPHKVIYLCPKYADENTPEPCRAWLRAINDTLDEEVDESLYQQSAIQKLFAAIQRSQFSPEERARMIEENHQEELRQTKFEEGMKKATQRIAERMLRQGIAPELIAEATGLSADELAELVGR